MVPISFGKELECRDLPVRIGRLYPRNCLDEQPILTQRGYELVDRRIPERRHHVENSTFVRSLEEAAYLVEQGYALRMGTPGKRASLIAPASLRIIRSQLQTETLPVGVIQYLVEGYKPS